MKHVPSPQGSFLSDVNKKDIKQLKKLKRIFITVAVVLVFIIGITAIKFLMHNNVEVESGSVEFAIPEYNGEAYIILNDNVPYFNPEDFGTVVFEEYSELDLHGRCGVAFANICHELMPTEDREEIGQVKPSGWMQEKYPGIVNSQPPYLYNRCHLIGFQLAGENANEKNLITGTRYFNVEGMLPFENDVCRYVDRTDNHVLYRVTPVYDGENLVASGVIIEAWSVEDNGAGICFNVFVYNIQPGIIIDYSDGSSKVEE